MCPACPHSWRCWQSSGLWWSPFSPRWYEGTCEPVARWLGRGGSELMTRDELIARTRQLVAEGDRLQLDPSLRGLQTWLQLSDDLLVAAWGSMDRYHLSWLMVGKPTQIVRGRPMTPDEESAYVREVAEAKTAALRMSLDAVERQGMPFVGEERGMAPGQGMGSVPGEDRR